MPLTRSKVLEPPQDHLLKRPGIRPAQAKIIRQDHRERTRAAWAPSGGPGRTDPYQLISPFSSSERARTHLIHGLAAVSGRGPERSAGSSGFPIEPCTGGCRTPSVQRAPTARPAVIPPGAAVMACPVVASGSGDHASSQRAISAAARAHNGQSACHRPGNWHDNQAAPIRQVAHGRDCPSHCVTIPGCGQRARSACIYCCAVTKPSLCGHIWSIPARVFRGTDVSACSAVSRLHVRCWCPARWARLRPERYWPSGLA